MTRHLSAAALAFALAGPIVLTTATPSEGASMSIRVRVYDSERRDYHRWDTREQRAYRQYLAERHRAYVRYAHQRREERRAYWRWRHEQLERERR